MKKIIGLFYAVLGVVVAVGVHSFLHVCGGDMEGMEGMASGPVCHGIPLPATVAGIVLAAAGLVWFLLSLFNKDNALTERIINLVVVIDGLLIIGIPTFIVGVCASKHMHCHAVTRPALIIIGAFAVVFAAGVLVKGLALSQRTVKEKLNNGTKVY